MILLIRLREIIILNSIVSIIFNFFLIVEVYLFNNFILNS